MKAFENPSTPRGRRPQSGRDEANCNYQFKLHLPMICNHHLHVYPNLLRTRLTKGTAAGHKKTACLHIDVLVEARPSALKKHEIERHAAWNEPRDASYIFGSFERLVVFN